jgi:hypothetical protein
MISRGEKRAAIAPNVSSSGIVSRTSWVVKLGEPSHGNREKLLLARLQHRRANLGVAAQDRSSEIARSPCFFSTRRAPCPLQARFRPRCQRAAASRQRVHGYAS